MGAERHDGGTKGLDQREMDLFPPDSGGSRVPAGPQSAVGLIQKEIGTLQLLDRFAFEDQHVRKAVEMARLFLMDLTPVRNRLARTQDVHAADIYKNLVEYVTTICRALRLRVEFGKDVQVMHPDRELLEAVYQYREQHAGSTASLLPKLEKFLEKLREKLSEEKGHKKAQSKT